MKKQLLMYANAVKDEKSHIFSIQIFQSCISSSVYVCVCERYMLKI